MAYPQLCVRGPPWNAQVPRAPLPNAGFPTSGSCHASPRKALPFVIARTGSCAEPIPFPSLWSNLVLLIFAGCYRPLLAIGPSRRYLCESFPRCLGPYHDGLQVALTCYFPCSIGLPQKSIGRRTVRFRSSDFTAEGIFEVAAISLCSGLSVCLPPWSLPPLQFPAGRFVTFTSEHVMLRYLRMPRIC
jgi:hypothetical protein